MHAPAKPTICHITTSHPADDVRIFRKECVSLAEAGYDVRLVAAADADAVVQGVRIEALPTMAGRAGRICLLPWLAYRKVLSLRPRPALCHFHDPALLPVGMALRLAGFRVVFDVHENIAEQILDKPYLPPWSRRGISLAYRLVEGVCCSGVATVHVLESIAARYRPPKAVVRNYPRLSLAPRRGPKPPGPPRLVYVGGLSRIRGMGTMIDAAAVLARRGVDFQMRFVGPIVEKGLEGQMRAAVAEANLEGKVVFTGPLPYGQAQQEAAAATLGFCLFLPVPNHLNSLPNKLLEYMAVGLPVVASDFDAWGELVEGTGAGVQVDPEDPAAVAEAVERLLGDPARLEEMSRRGLEEAGRRNWQSQEQVLLAFYERLLRCEAARAAAGGAPAGPTGGRRAQQRRERRCGSGF